MKKFLVLIISFIFAVAACLAGCGGETGGSSDSTGSGGSSAAESSSGGTNIPDDVPETAYTVTLVLPDGVSTMPDLTGIQAKWTSNTSVYTADFNASGFAYCDGLDGEYTVTIAGTLDSYTYNPNIYSADGNNKNVEIQLLTISSFDSGMGTSQFYDAAKISETGVYRLTFTSSGQKLFVKFFPNLVSTSYIYSFETMADATANEICPNMVFYPPQSTYQVPLTSNMYDDIVITSNSGTFTKNFVYTKKYSSTTGAGSAYFFVFTIDTIDDDYSEPKYLDIVITRVSEYDDTQARVYQVEVEDYNTTCDTPTGALTWVSDICNGDLSNCEVELKSDGFWYIYYNDEWYMLYAELNTCHYDSTIGGVAYDFTSAAYYILWDEEDENGYPSYVNVITTYMGDSTLVSGSYHPVTPQLKTFLYCRATATSNGPYFYDGDGMLEKYYGLTSGDDTMWLFACGFYM